ncbi:MAG: beta-ketoacyl synthase N-terminal-like domain-containing protein, partial [Thermoanaerobaculia bacterium]
MPQKQPDPIDVEDEVFSDLELDLGADSGAGEQSLAPPPDFSAREEISERAETVLVSDAGQSPSVVKLASRSLAGETGRVAIIDGCRTPFAKSGTDLRNMDVVDLCGVAVAELIARNDFDPRQIDASIFGVVVPALQAPNLGREVVFRVSLPPNIPGSTVNLACASSSRAITSGAEAILTGQCEVVLAGGAESLSNVPIQYSRKAAHRLIEFS